MTWICDRILAASLLVFSWVNHGKSPKIGTEHTLTSESEAATLQTWICLWNTWQHILPSVAKKASTTSTVERSTAAAGEQTHQVSSDGLSKSSEGSDFDLESCHRLIDLSTAPLSLQYTEMQKDPMIQSDTIRPQGTFEPNSDWLPKNLAAVITQLFAWIGIQCHRTACKFLRHDVISPNIPQPFWMQPAAKTSPSSTLRVSFVSPG